MKCIIQIASLLLCIPVFSLHTMQPHPSPIDQDLFNVIASGKNGNTIFNVADDVKRLVEQGANVNAQDPDGNTPLGNFVALWAIWLKDKPEYSKEVKQAEGVAKFLIAQGADVNKPNRFGTTPLMEAVHYDGLWAAQVLVENGATILAKNLNGKTALDMAREKMEKRKKEMLQTYYRGKQPSWWQVWKQEPPIDENAIYPIYTYLKNKEIEEGWQTIDPTEKTPIAEQEADEEWIKEDS